MYLIILKNHWLVIDPMTITLLNSPDMIDMNKCITKELDRNFKVNTFRKIYKGHELLFKDQSKVHVNWFNYLLLVAI